MSDARKDKQLECHEKNVITKGAKLIYLFNFKVYSFYLLNNDSISVVAYLNDSFSIQ